MPLPIVENGYQVILKGSIYGQSCMNVMYVHSQAGPTDQAAVLTKVVAGWIDPVRAFQSASWQWTEVLIKSLNAVDLPTFPAALSGKGGQLAGGQSLTFASIVFSLKTTVGNRTGRGRLYVPGLQTDAFTNGLVNDAIKGLFTTSVRPAMIANLNLTATGASNITIGVLSKKLGLFRPCLDGAMRAVAAVQRRRNVGVGM